VSIVRTTIKVYGKRQALTFNQPKTFEPIVTKYEWRDYVVDVYHQKLGLIRPGVLLPNTPLMFEIYYIFWFFNPPTDESVRPIFTRESSVASFH